MSAAAAGVRLVERRLTAPTAAAGPAAAGGGPRGAVSGEAVGVASAAAAAAASAAVATASADDAASAADDDAASAADDDAASAADDDDADVAASTPATAAAASALGVREMATPLMNSVGDRGMPCNAPTHIFLMNNTQKVTNDNGIRGLQESIPSMEESKQSEIRNAVKASTFFRHLNNKTRKKLNPEVE